MEQVNISELAEFQDEKVTKKVPIMTDQLMGTVLFINSHKEKLMINESEYDRIYYVVSGSGTVKTDELKEPIVEGSVFLVHRKETVYFSTEENSLIVLYVRSILKKKRC
jgi:mannose-6-phosphate isomerase-like protein (cupin superfamily)